MPPKSVLSGREATSHARIEGWTWRRVPGRLATAFATAAVIAVLCFAGHVSGWGALPRASSALLLSATAVGLLFGLPAAFLVGAPLLRALTTSVLERQTFIVAAAGFYGGLTFLWMALIPVGPPQELADAMLGAPGPEAALPAWWLPAILLYRHLLTPLAFGLYGALAAWGGWRIAFGRAARVAVLEAR